MIPAKVIGKFSLRIVPNMDKDKVEQLVVNHVNNLWALRGSSNDMRFVLVKGLLPS